MRLIKPWELRELSRLYCAQAFSHFPAWLGSYETGGKYLKPGWSGITSTQIILRCRLKKRWFGSSEHESEWTSEAQAVSFFSIIADILFKVFSLQRQLHNYIAVSILSVFRILLEFDLLEYIDRFNSTLTFVFLQVLCKHTPSCTSPFLFSCMAISKLLCKILLSVLIQSSISTSLSAANRYVLLSCIFSSKANLRTLLFCSRGAD